jgi:hypothetical protein
MCYSQCKSPRPTATENRAKTCSALATGPDPNPLSDSLTLSATCIDCYTTGIGILSTSAFITNNTLLGDVAAAAAELAKAPQAFISEAIDVTFEIDFQGLSGHFEFDISFATAGTFTVPFILGGLPVDIGVS